MAPVQLDCPGPFVDFAQCEIKISWVMDVRPESWLDKRGLNRDRCSIQDWYSESVNGAYCPATNIPTMAPVEMLKTSVQADIT